MEQHKPKLEQQATHWHGKCNLLCKMKNTRRVGAGVSQGTACRQTHSDIGVIETDKHREKSEERDRKRGVQTERQPQWEPHNARYYRANNNGTTGGYKHNSIFI